MIISSPADFRLAARRKLPRFLFDYIDSGAGTETTLRRNVEDLSQLSLRQRVLTGVSEVHLATTLFGRAQSLPIILAPVGLTGMYARRGEVQAARAARAKDIPFCLSTVSVCGIHEVVTGAASPIWFQLYVIRDRSFMRDLLATAKSEGCTALVFTVDMPIPGARYRDAHSGMSGPYAKWRRFLQAVACPQWAWDVGVRGRPHSLGNITAAVGDRSTLADFMGWLSANFDPTVTWDDIEWIRSLWDGPLIIKGILDTQDALTAARIGADGIVVSNHGGRQLDGTLSSVRALPAVVDAVGDRLTVLADSGIRSGVDIVRMLALGAKGVLLGRTWVYALATHGEAGVLHLISLLEREMRITMTLSGVSDVRTLDRGSLYDMQV
jgi:L-lactate dehydrogenase (cytochrome)